MLVASFGPEKGGFCWSFVLTERLPSQLDHGDANIRILESSTAPYRNLASLSRKEETWKLQFILVDDDAKQRGHTGYGASTKCRRIQCKVCWSGFQLTNSLFYERVLLAEESRNIARFTVPQQGGTNNGAIFVCIVNKILAECREMHQENSGEKTPGVRGG